MQRVNTVLHGESLTDASATKFCNSTQMFCLQFQKRNVGFWKCVVREFQVSYTLLLPHFDLFSRISGFLGKRPHFIESPFYREKLASEKVLRSPFYRIPILSRTYCRPLKLIFFARAFGVIWTETVLRRRRDFF